MVGRVVRERRRALGWTQGDLAARIGMPGGQSYISAVERGAAENLELDTVDRLAAALHTTPAVLLGLEPQAASPIPAVPTARMQALGWSAGEIRDIEHRWPTATPAWHQRVLDTIELGEAAQDALRRLREPNQGQLRRRHALPR